MNKRTSEDPDYESEAPSGAVLRIDARSLSQEAYDHIKRLILSGAFKDGEKIPEEKIAQILNVSRTPIREALRQLGQYGLVEIKPRSYAKVASVTAREADQIARIRVELEKLAARSLLKNASKKDLQALSAIAKKSVAKVRSGNLSEAFELDSEFHLEMVRRSDNSILYDILERLDAKGQLVRIRIVAARPIELVEEAFSEHGKIVTCLEEGNERDLMRAIETHIIPET